MGYVWSIYNSKLDRFCTSTDGYLFGITHKYPPMFEHQKSLTTPSLCSFNPLFISRRHAMRYIMEPTERQLPWVLKQQISQFNLEGSYS